jgi:hypothetical protein
VTDPSPIEQSVATVLFQHAAAMTRNAALIRDQLMELAIHLTDPDRWDTLEWVVPAIDVARTLMQPMDAWDALVGAPACRWRPR